MVFDDLTLLTARRFKIPYQSFNQSIQFDEILDFVGGGGISARKPKFYVVSGLAGNAYGLEQRISQVLEGRFWEVGLLTAHFHNDFFHNGLGLLRRAEIAFAQLLGFPRFNIDLKLGPLLSTSPPETTC